MTVERCKEDKHSWGESERITEPDFGVTLAFVKTCKVCGWREFNDLCANRVGNVFRIIPPAEEVK
jgi:hypothetical protein